MRVYNYYGPSPRRAYSLAHLVHLALCRLPGVESYSFDLSGDPALHGKRDMNLLVIEPGEPFDLTWPAPEPWVRWEHGRIFTSRNQEGVPRHFPLCAEPLAWAPHPEIAKDADVVFLGPHGDNPARVRWLDGVFKMFPSFLVDDGPSLEDGAAFLARGRVVIEPPGNGAVSLYAFAALSSGSCAVLPRTDDMDDLGIVPGIHCLAYNEQEGGEGALARIRSGLNMSEVERTDMGMRARELVLRRHTVVHRALVLLSVGGRGANYVDVDPDVLQRAITTFTSAPAERGRHALLPVQA